MIRARIVGTGHHLPEKVLTNLDLEKTMDTSDEWIRQRTGVAQRHLAAEGEGTADLAAPAAQQALEAAAVKPSEIDLVICATTTPDHIFPASSCLIQRQIGAHGAAAFDLNAACSGFLYALAVADSLISSRACKTILLVGADILTNHINWQRRDTAVLFGDGAGAVVIKPDQTDHGVLAAYLGADGRCADLLMIPAGGSKQPVKPETFDTGDLDIVMQGRELFRKAVAAFCEAAQNALHETQMTVDDIDLFIPHQANTRIIYAATDRLQIPREKVFVNVENVANTTAASIPIALDQARREGKINDGDAILMAAFGAGLTWASVMLRW